MRTFAITMKICILLALLLASGCVNDDAEPDGDVEPDDDAEPDGDEIVCNECADLPGEYCLDEAVGAGCDALPIDRFAIVETDTDCVYDLGVLVGGQEINETIAVISCEDVFIYGNCQVAVDADGDLEAACTDCNLTFTKAACEGTDGDEETDVDRETGEDDIDGDEIDSDEVVDGDDIDGDEIDSDEVVDGDDIDGDEPDGDVDPDEDTAVDGDDPDGDAEPDGDEPVCECRSGDLCCTDGCHFDAPDTNCGSGPTECSGQDTCNDSGVCRPNDFPEFTACGDAPTDCAYQDTCNGAGTCRDNGFAADGTACGENDQCVSGVCLDCYDEGGCGSNAFCDQTNQCTCHIGYTGDNCQTPICDPPCENGGSCVNPDTCDCSGTGYEGATCQTPICDPPCENGGSCVNPDTCDCSGTGYEGATCQTPICDPPCENGGSCVNPDTCDCSGTGYEGATCQTPICDPPCENGGSCVNPDTCDCSGTGYEGATCQTPICDPPCENGGSCVNPDTCDCSGTGYMGNACHIPICDPPCGHGTCIAADTCECYAGYEITGDRVDVDVCRDINECETDNGGCDVHAACINLQGSHTCECNTGYEGDGWTCNDIDGCQSDPCFEGVACTDMPAPGTGFACGDCPTGYEGDGLTCNDIDGCLGDPCFEGVACTDVPAPGTGFTCGDCPEGYEGDGESCHLACPEGFAYDGERCMDIDECAQGLHECPVDHTCENLCGSAACRPDCFGLAFDDPLVCSGHGECVDADTCECKNLYDGDDCAEFVTCDGLRADDPDVCSGHGDCVAPDTCACEHPYASHRDAAVGVCAYVILCADGYADDEEFVCGGLGTCVFAEYLPDGSPFGACECPEGIGGESCGETLKCHKATSINAF